MVMLEVVAPSATTGPVPVIVELAATGAPPMNITVPPVLEIGVSILSVFTSAFVDLREQVDEPLALEVVQVL
jgi:hypothetical protein